jgi:ABC-2 type transport system ATP-binding protein
MRSAAEEGRTVFVSSHLMSEMAVTADHLIVLGRGRVIADTGIDDFIARSGLGDILVRSPRGPELARVLEEHGGSVVSQPDGALAVTDLDITAVSAIAADRRLPVHELTRRQPSLEEAYMKLTESAVEYAAHPAAPSAPAANSLVS